MPFLDHVGELRKHLIRIIIGVLIFTIVAAIFFDFFKTIIKGPLSKDFITYQKLNSLGNKIGVGELFGDLSNIDFHTQKMTEDFNSYIISVLIIGLILGLPYVVFELWRFVLPGLTQKEKKYSFASIFFINLFFLLGVFFAYFLVAPFSVQFFYTFNPFDSIRIWTIGSYIRTVAQMILGMGVLFLLPVIVYFLTKIGILTPKFLIQYRKHSFVVVLMIAAIITPSDLISMFIAALPLWLLYEFSVLIAKMVHKKTLSEKN